MDVFTRQLLRRIQSLPLLRSSDFLGAKKVRVRFSLYPSPPVNCQSLALHHKVLPAIIHQTPQHVNLHLEPRHLLQYTSHRLAILMTVNKNFWRRIRPQSQLIRKILHHEEHRLPLHDLVEFRLLRLHQRSLENEEDHLQRDLGNSPLKMSPCQHRHYPSRVELLLRPSGGRVWEGFLVYLDLEIIQSPYTHDMALVISAHQARLARMEQNHNLLVRPESKPWLSLRARKEIPLLSIFCALKRDYVVAL